jgi:hypothetical protein
VSGTLKEVPKSLCKIQFNGAGGLKTYIGEALGVLANSLWSFHVEDLGKGRYRVCSDFDLPSSIIRSTRRHDGRETHAHCFRSGPWEMSAGKLR